MEFTPFAIAKFRSYFLKKLGFILGGVSWFYRQPLNSLLLLVEQEILQ
jgi:hypothetical protein